jgi:mannose-6-phosphate isomerase-like protein (cupin superfamily)
MIKRFAFVIFLLIVPCAFGAERTVAPTWLHRNVANIPERSTDITTPSCHYKPLFGAGDSETGIVRSVARFGEVTIDPAGNCKEVSYPAEEQIYYILAGNGTVSYGEKKTSVKKDDFMYLPPQVRHGLANTSASPLRVVVMGFNIPHGASIPPPPSGLQMANANDVKLELVSGHPKSTQFRLLLGGSKGTRDKIDCATVVTSLFLMEFTPGGTNFPHHHDTAEEIYLILDGHGNIVAGGGKDGIEGLHPGGPGDAYFFRLNSTVGFYNTGKTRAHILAVRSWYPFSAPRYGN